MGMTPRERLLATARFEPVDRPWRAEAIGFWPETIKRWHNEGLPKNVNDDLTMYVNNGFDLQCPLFLGSYMEPGFFPLFEEKILERTERYIVKRDFKGALIKVFSDGSSMIPVTLESPVKDRATWEAVKPRLSAEDPGRLKIWQPFIQLAKAQPWPLCVYICGLFGTHRHLLGFEKLMTSYYDQPDLLHDISRNWVAMYKAVIAQVHEQRPPDMVSLWEDMCGKAGPLIGPRMFEEFMSPYYKELIGFVREDLRIPVVGLDTDGDLTLLIPKFVEAGVNMLWPFEVQAGMDVLKVREEWPNQFVIWGGMDKRVLARDKKAIEREVMRVVPSMLAKRGYIPALDHTVPPDVPYENWLYYRDLVRQVGEKGG